MFQFPETKNSKIYNQQLTKLSDSHKMKTYNTIRIKSAKTTRGNTAAININIYTIFNDKQRTPQYTKVRHLKTTRQGTTITLHITVTAKCMEDAKAEVTKGSVQRKTLNL